MIEGMVLLGITMSILFSFMYFFRNFMPLYNVTNVPKVTIGFLEMYLAVYIIFKLKAFS